MVSMASLGSVVKCYSITQCLYIYILHLHSEICLLFKCRRVASVRAVTVCDLYSLDRSDFDIILKRFPKMRQV